VVPFLQKYFDPINAKNTDLKLVYVGGPEVTPAREQAGLLKRGLVDMIYCPSGYYSGLFPEARLTGVQTVSIAEIHKNGAWDMLEQAWNKNLNAHLLAWVYDHAQIFYTYYVKKPEESTKTGLDLNGFKMRATTFYIPFLKAMGATPVVIPVSDVYAGLQRGVVDGIAFPWGSVGKFGWERFIKYRVKPGYFGASMQVIINLDKWKSLSKAQQNLLTEQGKIYEKEGPAAFIKNGEKDDAKLKKAGVVDIVLKGAVRKAYLKTIYDTKWKELDSLKYSVDYKKLKPLLFNRE